MAKGEFLGEEEHRRWDENQQKEIWFHQRQRLMKYRHGQWQRQGTLHLYVGCYRLEKHTVLSET